MLNSFHKFKQGLNSTHLYTHTHTHKNLKDTTTELIQFLQVFYCLLTPVCFLSFFFFYNNKPCLFLVLFRTVSYMYIEVHLLQVHRRKEREFYRNFVLTPLPGGHCVYCFIYIFIYHTVTVRTYDRGLTKDFLALTASLWGVFLIFIETYTHSCETCNGTPVDFSFSALSF